MKKMPSQHYGETLAIPAREISSEDIAHEHDNGNTIVAETREAVPETLESLKAFTDGLEGEMAQLRADIGEECPLPERPGAAVSQAPKTIEEK
jgi:hypothetical protein